MTRRTLLSESGKIWTICRFSSAQKQRQPFTNQKTENHKRSKIIFHLFHHQAHRLCLLKAVSQSRLKLQHQSYLSREPKTLKRILSLRKYQTLSLASLMDMLLVEQPLISLIQGKDNAEKIRSFNPIRSIEAPQKPITAWTLICKPAPIATCNTVTTRKSR